MEHQGFFSCCCVYLVQSLISFQEINLLTFPIYNNLFQIDSWRIDMELVDRNFYPSTYESIQFGNCRDSAKRKKNETKSINSFESNQSKKNEDGNYSIWLIFTRESDLVNCLLNDESLLRVVCCRRILTELLLDECIFQHSPKCTLMERTKTKSRINYERKKQNQRRRKETFLCVCVTTR